jgi:hypothetical protein
MAAPPSVPVEPRRRQYDRFLKRIFAPLPDESDALPPAEPEPTADDERGKPSTAPTDPKAAP